MKAELSIFRKEKVFSYAIPIAFFVGLMVLSAKVMIPLAITPVPITLQVFVVLLSSLLLGSRGAVFVQSSYLGLILIGVPVTAFGFSGPAAFVGPTAGYLLAFLPAAYVVGLIKERSKDDILHLTMAALAGIVLIYLGGTTWLAVYLHNWEKAWLMGAAPFVMVDLAKAAFAVVIARGLTKSLVNLK